MKTPLIKVGFCIAYDWELLKKSIPRIYDSADIIWLSIDKNRKSWSGKPYAFDEKLFNDFINSNDADKKIHIYEDDFSLPELSPIENDNRQRSLLAHQMGEGGWHIQVDSDEYFLDFQGFVEYLKKINPDPKPTHKPLNICCNWISLIKKVPNGYLFVDNDYKHLETMPFATNLPVYTSARRNGHFNHISPFYVLHETWARGEQELWQKINSWGHDTDFADKKSYFELWKVLDDYNYRYIYNLHPVKPEVWTKLGFCKGETIDLLIENILRSKSFYLPDFYLWLKNSRNLARIKSVLNR